MASNNRKRFIGITRDRQGGRVKSWQNNNPRFRNFIRTVADNPMITTKELQVRQSRTRGRQSRTWTMTKKDYQGYVGGASYTGRLGERISKAGNAVVGRDHNKRYREIRKALGLSSG